MPSASPAARARRVALLVFLAVLTAVVLLGGASRIEVPGPVGARLAALAALVWAIGWHPNAAGQTALAPLALLAALAVVMALQLVPLPPEVWRGLPGRALIAEIDSAAGLGARWRPLSLTPDGTLDALLALLPAFAALVLMARVDREDRLVVAVWLCGLIVLSALIGLLQLNGASELYFYAITNRGSPVGLFANRNHQAFMLALAPPLLATVALLARRRTRGAGVWNAALASVAALCLIAALSAGSRMGAALFALSSILAVALFLSFPPSVGRPVERRPAGSRRSARVLVAGIGAGIVLASIAAAIALRSPVRDLPVLDRFAETSIWREARIDRLDILFGLATDYLPFGAGFGSFPIVYKIAEPSDRLYLAYLNHAHNEPIELAVEGGLAGLALGGLLVALWARGSWRAWRDGRVALSSRLAFARLGSIVALVLLLASLTDYPLRTPALAFIMALALAWLSPSSRAQDRQGWTARDASRNSPPEPGES